MKVNVTKMSQALHMKLHNSICCLFQIKQDKQFLAQLERCRGKMSDVHHGHQQLRLRNAQFAKKIGGPLRLFVTKHCFSINSFSGALLKSRKRSFRNQNEKIILLSAEMHLIYEEASDAMGSLERAWKDDRTMLLNGLREIKEFSVNFVRNFLQ